MTPDIIQESNQGISCIPIRTVLYQNREVFCVGEITRESALSLIMQLRYLQLADPGSEITMYIDSPGGELSSGLSILDVMEGLQCPIRTLCFGCAYSMAAILFAAGRQRDILPHARVMIHDPLVANGVGGSALHLDLVAQNLMQTRTLVAEILVKYTGRSLEEVYQKTRGNLLFVLMLGPVKHLPGSCRIHMAHTVYGLTRWGAFGLDGLATAFPGPLLCEVQKSFGSSWRLPLRPPYRSSRLRRFSLTGRAFGGSPVPS